MPLPPDRRSPRFVFLTDDLTPGLRSPFAWRLEAANNRPLGRSAAVSAGLAACRATAAAVIAGLSPAVIETGTAATDFGPAAGVELGVEVERLGAYWHWRLDVPGGSAVSTHRYLRRTECLRGFTQFVDVAGRADPQHGPVRCFGPETLRGYAVPAEATTGTAADTAAGVTS